MKRRWTGNEAGALELGAGILVLIGLLAIPLTIAAAQDLYDIASGRWGPRQEQAAPVPAVTIPFLGPALPSQDPARTCYLNRAGSLQWTAQGWRSPDYPAPTLTGDPAIDRGRVQPWQEAMQGLIASADFPECDRPEEPPPPPQDDRPADDPNVSGNYPYNAAYQGGPPLSCNANGFQGTFQVTQPGRGRVVVNIGEPLEGTLERDLSFAVQADRDSVRGRFFIDRGGTVTIQSGTISFGTSNDNTCVYTFDAQRA